MRDLKQASRRQYLDAVREFFWHVEEQDVKIRTRAEVDAALCKYMTTLSRHQATMVLAAMVKSYPPLKGHLPWAAAQAKALGTVDPVVHHVPLPWQLAVGIAYSCCQAGWPRRGLLFLIQWRFGLRPGEAVSLIRGDIFLWMVHGGPLSYIRLGARNRGTKVRRPQIARAKVADPLACWLLVLAWLAIADGERIGGIATYPTYANAMRHALSWLQLKHLWTPHSLRSGWASALYAAGTPFTEIREDGRWASDTALRIYLDSVTSSECLHLPRVQALRPRLTNWEATLHIWLPEALGVDPSHQWLKQPANTRY